MGNLLACLIIFPCEHTNQAAIAYDQVPPLTDLTVSVKTPARPAKIVMQPGGKEMKFIWFEGKSTVLIPKLDIHSILEIVE